MQEQSGCNITDACFCTDDTLDDKLETCILSSCPPDDQLAAAKFQANACNNPVRDRSSLVSSVTWSLFAVASLFTIARIFARWPVLRGAGYHWDDWTLFLCVPFAVAIAVAVTFDIKGGYGRDAWELNADQIEDFLYWFYICQPLYLVVIFGCKLSLVLLYLRTWPDKTVTKFRITCWFVVVALILTIIGTVLATIFQCLPVQYSWNMVAAEANSHCTDRVVQVYTIAAINIAFDAIVLSLPLPKILKLDLSNAQKLGLCLVFLTGSVVTICSGIRIMYMDKFANSANVTWDYTDIGIWSIVEVFLSITCASMPATVGLIKRGIDFALNRVEAIETTSMETDSQHDPEMARILALGLSHSCACCSRDQEKPFYPSSMKSSFYPSSMKGSDISVPPSAILTGSDVEDGISTRGPLDLESQTLDMVREELTWETPAPQLAQVYKPEQVRVRYVPART